MPGFNLITSNYLEELADKLAELYKVRPLSLPLAGEVIIVQSQGMARWLSLALAERLGICANYNFPFPNSFIQTLFSDIPAEPRLKSALDNDIITLKVMKALPGLIGHKEFDALKSYLDNDRRNLKLYQLAGKIAETFERYTVYRPEMTRGWENGEDDHWQAILWRYLITDNRPQHIAALAYAFLESKNSVKNNFSGLPERVTVFGIPSLPPLYIQLFLELAKFTDIYYYVMNPCREFWADIVTDKETERIAGKFKSAAVSTTDLHLERGNSLLASLGALGREFFAGMSQADIDENSYFREPDSGTMLATIQADILNLKDRGHNNTGQASIAADDNSIQIHSCHSPMREIEVLHDNLLAMFENDKDLTPRDILVMTPDIEKYAPFIQAVFSAPEDQPNRIPFSIADRSFNRESPVIDAFLELLELADSRYESSRVAALLEMSVIHAKFGLTAVDIELISEWIRASHIRWGIDRKHREFFGLPGISQNTWRFGLDRLLLGYAMPGYHEQLFGDMLPYDNMEGDRPEILGKFAELFDRLADLAAISPEPKSLTSWASVLTGICETFIIANENTQRELQIIRHSLDKLIDNQELADFNEPIYLDIIRACLKERFAGFGQGFGFIAGAVTFCALLPMRSIPFKVICLVGLNHDSFPRQARHLNFDLIAQNPRPGDRSIRNTDRYLFLETLLSARQRLYLSYVGQSIQDNCEIPPSVVISELWDYIRQGFRHDQRGGIGRIMTKHRLQAFSPEYFKPGNRIFSYSRENHEAAVTLTGQKLDPMPYISRSLPDPDESFHTLTVDQLCGFFKNPSRYLLNARFEIYLSESDFSLADRLPYALTGFDKYDLESKLLAKYLEGADIKSAMPLLKAEGLLPHGTPGEVIFRNILEEITAFAGIIKPYQTDEAWPPLEIDCEIASCRISGQIDSIKQPGLVRYRPADVKARDLLATWINHLFINLTGKIQYPRESYYLGKDRVYKFKPIADPEKILGDLLGYYRRGLLTPLKFFPETSYVYSARLVDGKSVNQALNAAANRWMGSDKARGEREDLYYRACFGQIDPLDNDFAQIAGEIFKPLLENCESIT